MLHHHTTLTVGKCTIMLFTPFSVQRFDVCVSDQPFDELLQSTPHLLHLSQTLLSGPAVPLQPPPALLQLATLMALLLQLVLQLVTKDKKTNQHVF